MFFTIHPLDFFAYSSALFSSRMISRIFAKLPSGTFRPFPTASRASIASSHSFISGKSRGETPAHSPQFVQLKTLMSASVYLFPTR